MPYASIEDYRACLARMKARSKQFVAEIRAKTRCAKCVAQPIAWHNPEHERKPYRRIARMAASGAAIASIQAEIAVCEPLCRRCHMLLDGRLVKLATKAWRPIKAAEPCVDCGLATKPCIKGLCRRCYDAKRRRSGRAAS